MRASIMVTYDGHDIVIRTAPPPRWLRLIFFVIGLVLLAIAVASAFNIASHLLWAPRPDVTASGLVLGSGLTIGFSGVAAALFYGASLPERTLRFDPHERRAHLTRRFPLGVVARSFDFAALTAPRSAFSSEDAESSAKWSLEIRLPGGTTIDYCASTLSLDGQKQFADVWSERIARMLAGAETSTPRVSAPDDCARSVPE